VCLKIFKRKKSVIDNNHSSSAIIAFHGFLQLPTGAKLDLADFAKMSALREWGEEHNVSIAIPKSLLNIKKSQYYHITGSKPILLKCIIPLPNEQGSDITGITGITVHDISSGGITLTEPEDSLVNFKCGITIMANPRVRHSKLRIKNNNVYSFID